MADLYRLRIDLHGYDVLSAIECLERIVYSRRRIRLEIVHGCGSGKLRTAVRSFLSTCPTVEHMAFGEDANLPGLSGVTVAYLR